MSAAAERESRSSDPLPYVQVDRAVRTSVVAPLAGVMNVSPQHVIGSVVQWWEMCGRPADLERIVNDTPAGIEPCVVLAADTVRRRFHLASGHQVRLTPAAAADKALRWCGDARAIGVEGQWKWFVGVMPLREGADHTPKLAVVLPEVG